MKLTTAEAIAELRKVDTLDMPARLCEAHYMAIKALEQEPCEDAISRQAVLDAIEELKKIHFDRVVVLNKVRDRALELPPVKPQEPKTGHWIERDGFDGDVYYDCSECGESWTTIEGTPWQNGMAYCPNCGARMESEE